ncbi:hypothetical protein G5I_13472 [Acromyrmex echinatior]|uniref:Uncharacterized protein n=1 Tax=Acromyrmex echinatior TaxID=103372 RepID=F4X540_ACREC|nr:hypothetical protein G5I_13472 [Acromyrmex echinatior]
MRAIVRQAESLSASPEFLSAIPTTSLLRTPQKHPTFRGDTRTHPACSVESSLPPRRGKAMTKNGEENKHSDSPNPVDDTQTVTVTGSTTTSTNTVHPSVNDMDWFAGVAEEELLYYTGVGNDVDSLWAVIGSFVPPPPRPPYLPEESIATDGLTTCDLCSWAWRNDRHSFSLDGTLVTRPQFKEFLSGTSRSTIKIRSLQVIRHLSFAKLCQFFLSSLQLVVLERRVFFRAIHLSTSGPRVIPRIHSTVFATYLFVKQLFQSSTCFRIWGDPSRINVNEGSLQQSCEILILLEILMKDVQNTQILF